MTAGANRAVADGPAANIVGGARYIVSPPGSAEVAFAIIDEFQGQGSLLMRHLLTIARAAASRRWSLRCSLKMRVLKVFEQERA
jgi:GNAT superfamily N-acetyltransferase